MKKIRHRFSIPLKFIGLLTAVCLVFTPLILPAHEKQERIITDMAGRSVVITGPVQRVVTTFKPASLCVLSLGLAHTLVGFGRFKLFLEFYNFL